MSFREANFDGLVGPTHNYAGLSPGNLASASNVRARAFPRKAALQGLDKMKALADMGLVQGVIPPHERPHVPTLRALGFTGDDAQVIHHAAKEAPHLLSACASASAMWTANAATVSPAPDTADGRTHFTPANLAGNLHRAIEAPVTTRILRAIFRDANRFAVHDPLPGAPETGDEGAANHTRLCASHGRPGVELFVFGRYAVAGARPEGEPLVQPARFPARQTYEASVAVARLHGLDPSRVVYAQQHPDAIDAGVFHNDVIAVGNENAMLYHEDAWRDGDAVLDQVRERLGSDVHGVRIHRDEVSVAEAVGTYLFNSQLITRPDGEGMMLVCPQECAESASVTAALQRVVEDDNPITRVLHFDVRESMRNGGGPACLRLRVALADADLASVNPGALLSGALHQRLTAWAERRYREQLDPADLQDPALVTECRDALDELTRILELGDIYDFQLA
ncbi:MAG: N-succinylarginine dihydrolase [Planctomycetota bacterium]